MSFTDPHPPPQQGAVRTEAAQATPASDARAANAIALLLLGLTAFSVALGHFSGLALPRSAAVLGILLAAGIKAQTIAMQWMHLNHAPAVWRWGTRAWLAVVMGGLALLLV